MRIYTRQGDQGKTTSKATSRRVYKHHPLIEIYGTLDELISTLDVVRIQKSTPKSINALLKTIQQDIFTLGTQLLDKKPDWHQEKIDFIERQIDKLDKTLTEINQFIFQSSNESCAYCQLARCVCRRLERRIIAFHRKQKINPYHLAYINRLSDLLFVVARKLNLDS